MTVPTISLIEQSEYLGDGLWRWSVALGPDSPVDDIKEVTYTLDPTFSRPVRRMNSALDRFRVEDISSCPFKLYAKVVFVDGHEEFLEKQLGLLHDPSNHRETVPRRTKPVILAVDDDASVLAALLRDLRSRYRTGYIIMSAYDGETALEIVRELTNSGNELALAIADVRMPQMSGLEFVSQALRIQPRAKFALLTAYTDVDVAVKALNSGLNAYLSKPWLPIEEMFPVVDGLLRDWWSTKGDLSVVDSRRTRVI